MTQTNNFSVRISGLVNLDAPYRSGTGCQQSVLLSSNRENGHDHGNIPTSFRDSHRTFLRRPFKPTR